MLFLTAKDAIEDRVRGLELGADDYLEVRQGLHLRPATAEDKDLVILVAAYLGATQPMTTTQLSMVTRVLRCAITASTTWKCARRV